MTPTCYVVLINTMGRISIFIAAVWLLFLSYKNGAEAVNANDPDFPPKCTQVYIEVEVSQNCMKQWLNDDQDMAPYLVIRGDRNHTCSLVIKNTAAEGEIVVQVQGYTNGTDYLYVERTKLSDDEYNRGKYIGKAHGNIDQCCLTFPEKLITVEFRGDLTLHVLLVQSSGIPAACPSPKGMTCTARNGTTCPGLVNYSAVISCYNRMDDTECDLECLPSEKCTLANNQVIYQYPDTFLQDPRSAMITYPLDLSSLDFSHNNLTSIASGAFLSMGWTLQQLRFSYNQLIIEETVFENLSELRALYLDHNELRYLTNGLFRGLNKLQILNLEVNDIHVLPEGVFQGLHIVSELVLFDNYLTNIIGVTSLSSLQSVQLSVNDLKVLSPNTFRGLNKLTELYLEDNMLLEIQGQPFDGFQCLKKLWLSTNHLTVLHRNVFRGLHNLTELNLKANELQVIHKDAFKSLTGLVTLQLEHNYLQDLNPGVFRHLGNLEDLIMNHNLFANLTDGLFQNLKNLRVLVLSKNRLAILRTGWFKGLHNLRELELWGNQLSAIETGTFQNLHNLEGLVIRGNMLETLEKATFKGLRNLKKLNLHKNNLHEIQPGVLDDMVNLTSLSLAYNKLSTLPKDFFKNTPRMEFLDLSENQLIDLPLIGHMFQLEKLILQGNTLEQAEQNVFSNLPSTVHVIVNQPEICVCLLNDSNEHCQALNQQSPYLTCQKMLPDTVLVIFMWVGGFGAMFGNLIVLFWRKTQPQEEYQVQKILIGNLALADLLMGMYMVIIASADVHYGDYFPMHAQMWRTGPVCILAGALAITSSEASILLLTVISIDRLIHMKYQMNKYKLRVTSAKFASLAVWLFALLISSLASSQANGNPDVYQASHVCVGLPLAQKPLHDQTATRYNKTEDIMYSVEEYSYWDVGNEEIYTIQDNKPGMYLSMAVFLVLNPLCCIIIAGCYIDIVITVFRSVGHMRRQRHIRHETRMTIKVFAIVATDLCCWCPIILTSILVQADVVIVAPRTFVWIVTFILPINSVINPYLYTLGNVIADRLPKAHGTINSRATCTTTIIDRPRPDPISHVNQPSPDENQPSPDENHPGPDEESDNTKLILNKRLVVMETSL